jgi:hypothetical protein
MRFARVSSDGPLRMRNNLKINCARTFQCCVNGRSFEDLVQSLFDIIIDRSLSIVKRIFARGCGLGSKQLFWPKKITKISFSKPDTVFRKQVNELFAHCQET